MPIITHLLSIDNLKHLSKGHYLLYYKNEVIDTIDLDGDLITILGKENLTELSDYIALRQFQYGDTHNLHILSTKQISLDILQRIK